jgi:N,N'-diacetylchitobiose non-reducing end deacetylase
MKPLVCIFAHPDDEALGPGGTIAKFAEEREVYLVCITDGSEGMGKGSKLAEIRKKELLRSSKILGVKKVEFLNYKDGSLCNSLYHEIAQKLTDILNKYGPDTLLTFELRGISGHLDHIAASLITTYVFYKLDFVKKIMYLCELKEAMDQDLDYFIYQPPGYNRKDIDYTVDIKKTWDKQVQAMKAHKSQIDDVEKVLSIKEKLPKEEHFKILEK